jgi:glycosyltransferase involved in cell wall biosynthesis
MPDRLKFSIVTPSYNQGAWLDAAMRSVLDQPKVDLEYLVVDGGSTDGSVKIIERYADRLAWWVSEKDQGHADALNKGFARATGEIMGFLNSDDMLTPWALSVVEEIFGLFPEVEWITTLHPLIWDARGRAVHCPTFRGFARRAFLRGENLPKDGQFATDFIQQESTFWRRSLWMRTGARFRADLHRAQDFELWSRFFSEAALYGVDTPLGGWRFHGGQKNGGDFTGYYAEAEPILCSLGAGRYSGVHRWWRWLAFNVCPAVLQPIAASLAGLYPSRIIRFNHRQNRWDLLDVYA